MPGKGHSPEQILRNLDLPELVQDLLRAVFPSWHFYPL